MAGNEVRFLSDLIEKKRSIVEKKSLELYNLKEQRSYIDQLRSKLEKRVHEIKMLNKTINSLRVDIKKLQGETNNSSVAEKQVGLAKNTVEELRTKMDVNSGRMKQQLMLLEEQVYEFRAKGTSITIEKNIKPIELKYMEMQGKKKELELEKRELLFKLLASQERVTALSTMTEDKIIAKMRKERSVLTGTKEELLKEVESLQSSRYNIVEEIVYQRWLNACLRYELQGTLSTKTSNSDKAKGVEICDSVSSHDSLTESNGIDSCSSTSTSTSTSVSSWSEESVFDKKLSGLQKVKRVSFCDSVGDDEVKKGVESETVNKDVDGVEHLTTALLLLLMLLVYFYLLL